MKFSSSWALAVTASFASFPFPLLHAQQADAGPGLRGLLKTRMSNPQNILNAEDAEAWSFYQAEAVNSYSTPAPSTPMPTICTPPPTNCPPPTPGMPTPAPSICTEPPSACPDTPAPTTPEPTTSPPTPMPSTPMPTICTPPPINCPGPTPAPNGVPTPAPSICTEPPSACPDTPAPTTPEPTTSSPTPQPSTSMPTICTPPPINCPEPTPAPITGAPTPMPSVCTEPPSNCPRSEMPTPTPTVCTEPPSSCEEPTPSPITGAPTPAPSICTKPPSSCPPPPSCEIDLDITPNCPFVSCEFDLCDERPFRMEFFYRGGDCTFTEFRRCEPDTNPCDCEKFLLPEDEWPNQNTCEDFNGGPPSREDRGTVSWIEAKPANRDEVYFAGPVAVGRFWNATDPALDRVQANMDIFVYEYDEVSDGPGILQQQVLFHSSCSQELYLADTFGGNQLVEFESDSQLVGLFRTSEFEIFFNVTLELDTGVSVLVLETFNLALFSANPFLATQEEDFDVNGTVIPPPLQLETNLTIALETNMTALTTLTGELDGQKCVDIMETPFRCERGP